VGVFRLHIRPGGGLDNPVFSFAYCLREEILGVGWQVIPPEGGPITSLKASGCAARGGRSGPWIAIRGERAADRIKSFSVRGHRRLEINLRALLWSVAPLIKDLLLHLCARRPG
jgi:hypothetical protein